MQNKKHNRDTRDMSDKLSDALGVERPRKPYYKNNNQNKSRQQNPNQGKNNHITQKSHRITGKDGVDFVNCSRDALTSLGAALSTQNRCNLNHSYLGPFNTIEGFMFFLQYEDDRFRDATAKDIYFLSMGYKKRRDAVSKIPHDRMMLFVADAYWQLVNSDNKLKNEMKANKLEFQMYRVNELGIRIRLRNAEWFTHIYKLIQEALQKDLPYPEFFKLFGMSDRYGVEDMIKEVEAQSKAGEDPEQAYAKIVENTMREHFKDMVDLDVLKQRDEQRKQRMEQALVHKEQRSYKQGTKAAERILRQTEEDLAKFNETLEKEQASKVEETQKTAQEIQEETLVEMLWGPKKTAEYTDSPTEVTMEVSPVTSQEALEETLVDSNIEVTAQMVPEVMEAPIGVENVMDSSKE